MPDKMESCPPLKCLPHQKIIRSEVELPTLKKKENAEMAMNWAYDKLDSLPIGAIKLFVDGSLSRDGKVGCGIYARLNNGETLRKYYRLQRGARNAYHGELAGILMAIKLCKNIHLKPGQKIYIISDCQSAVKISLNPNRHNSVSTDIYSEMQENPDIANLVWIPSHLGVPGNEEADRLANLGASKDDAEVIVLEYDLAFWYNYIDRAVRELWAKQWENNKWDSPALRKILPDLRDHPGFLLNNNRIDKQLARVRMDYVSLNGFCYRHKLLELENGWCDKCTDAGEEELVIQSAEHHLLHCKAYATDRKVMTSEICAALDFCEDYDLDITDILRPTKDNKTDFKIAEAILNYIESSFGGFM